MSEQLMLALAEQDVPQGYKKTEVGVIPEDWVVFSMLKLCDVRDGTHDSPKYKDHGVPLVTSKNIINNKLDLTDVSLISKEDAIEINKRSKVDKGDIIMSMIGTVGSAVLLVKEPEFCIKNVALFKPMKILGDFLIQLIESDVFQNYLEDSMDGGIQKFVSLGTLRNMSIAIPERAEQTAIATALSDVDALITELEKLIAKKQAIKTATMQQLLTGRTRLPQFALRDDGTPKGYKASELGEIPEDWEVVKLGDLCSLKSGLGITSQDISNSGKYSCYGGNGLRGYTSTYTHEGEYALIGRQGALCGNIQYVTGRFFASEHALVATAQKQVMTRWLAISLDRMNLNQYSESSAQPGLSAEKLRVLNLVTPPFEEQTAIATILSDMDSDIDRLQQRLSKTRQIKQGMMQELLTGKTRLKV